MIVPNEEGEIDYEVLDKRYPIVDWESKFYHTDRYGIPHDYYRVFRADGSSRYIKTFTEKVSRTMFEANAEDDLWKNQEEWILKSWNFYDNCGVHILVLEDGTEFYMLAERRYPLTKETLERMLALRLIAKFKSEAVFDLLRFIQKQIDESEIHDGNVISEVPNSENYLNDTVPDICVQEESYLEQLTFNPNLDIDITNDSNIISYEQYLQETKSAAVQNNISSNQQNAMIMSVFDALSDQVAKCTVDNLKHKELDESLTAELKSYKEQVKQFEERQNVDLNNHEKYIESQMNDIILNVKNVVMHSNVHKVSSINTNCLDNGNRALECLQMENDRLMELLISQDLVHTHVNTLATINDYKSM
ncbi:hypothetical protein Tco_1455961 [Tanacetum coccineum]